MTAQQHDPVNAPRHYRSHPSGVECIEVARHMTFAAGNAVKYVWRASLKNGGEDLRKAEFYLLDALTYDTDVFPTYDGRETAQTLLNAVIRAEETSLYPEHPRVRFFNAVWHSDRPAALAALRDLIANVGA